MKVERFGKQVCVTFQTEVQASDFQRRMLKVLAEKRRERAELQKKFSKEIGDFRRKEEKRLWSRRR